jgi:signal transduction histidine kinase
MKAQEANMRERLEHQLRRQPILNRLLIGNSLVIIVGAVGGTLLTRSFPDEANIWLILLFSTLGISLSLLVNYWIVKSALNPLHELSALVDRVQAGPIERERLPEILEPSLNHLSLAINSMLDRLAERSLQMRALSQRAINAQEEERKRIARQRTTTPRIAVDVDHQFGTPRRGHSARSSRRACGLRHANWRCAP